MIATPQALVCILMCATIAGFCQLSVADREFNDVLSVLEAVFEINPSLRNEIGQLPAEEVVAEIYEAFELHPDLSILFQKEQVLFQSDSLTEIIGSNAFKCEPFNSSRVPRPMNVRQLTPATVEVVGAMGDSLSAGTGVLARTLIGILNQYRGRVFSIGGDLDADSNPTLVNLLRKYNPNIKGFSVGIAKANNTKKAKFNVAVPAMTSTDLMRQAEQLVDRMRTELSPAEFEESWKMVTIFMGQNDIGKTCKEPDIYNVMLYRKRFEEALDYLKVNLPRTLVNVVTMLDVYLAAELNIGLVCKTVHLFEGVCSTYPKDKIAVKLITDEFQQSIEDLVNTGRYADSGTFTVVVQPFFKETVLPRKANGNIDLSYFAPDCFHFSQKGHNDAALALWNALFQPVGRKAESWTPGEAYYCPTPESPFFET